MNFLIDYNIQKYAAILLGKIASDGWLDLISIRFIFFNDINLPIDSDDRTIWQVSHKNRMILHNYKPQHERRKLIRASDSGR
jgi:hypothetical protein